MVFKYTLLAVYIVLLTVSAFGQFSELALYPLDTRFELAYENDNPVGYNLFVRKKPGIESVMVTEPTGNYALRSLGWNAVNGNERRELAGVTLTDTYSRFSILSSTPISDRLFGETFQLFIPSWVVYGNPSSPNGIVYMDIKEGAQINIRTFDHKYGDPKTGSFFDYSTMVSTVNDNFRLPVARPVMETTDGIYRELKSLLSFILLDKYKPVLNSFTNDYDLVNFLNEAFEEGLREQNNK